MKILFLLLMSLSLWAGIGNIMAMKGSAQVVRSSGSVEAKNGLELLEHDRIQTQKKSRVQVMLLDSTVVTIGAKSSFSFDTFSYDGTKNSKVAMSAQRGFFRSVTGKIGHLAPERFKVKTVSATIGIRGTDFSDNIMSDYEVIKCNSGVITVSYNGNEREVLAGMQIEIHKDSTSSTSKSSFKAKKSSTSKKDTTRTHTASATSVKSVSDIVTTNTAIEIPTEAISDVTQIANDPVNNPQEPVADPFNITTGVEDRPVEY